VVEMHVVAGVACGDGMEVGMQEKWGGVDGRVFYTTPRVLQCSRAMGRIVIVMMMVMGKGRSTDVDGAYDVQQRGELT
jgi:hypothetical protein